jgi:hypothetical protein
MPFKNCGGCLCGEEGVREQERWDRMKTTMVPCGMPSLCIVMLYCLLCVAHVYYMNVRLLPVIFFRSSPKLDEEPPHFCTCVPYIACNFSGCFWMILQLQIAIDDLVFWLYDWRIQ